MITMRTKSPWGLHVPSVETQMMPAFLWVQQTVVFPKIHWAHCLVVHGEDEAIVLVDVFEQAGCICLS